MSHNTGQLSIFASQWINGRDQEPPDGTSIVYYYLFENPEQLSEWELKSAKDYNGQKLGGPSTGHYNKKYHDDGTYRPVAYWQPLELLV